MENLLSYHGADFIDRVEAQARSNPQFAYFLGGVWRDEMTDEVWARVQAVWERRGWDGIPPAPISPIPDVYRAFAGFSQPSQYVIDDLYESERLDYEEMLGGKPREALEAKDFGSVNWGPLSFLTAEANAYLLPRLLELAESGSKDKHGEPFLFLVLYHLSEGPSSARFSLLGVEQKSLVTAHLQYVAEHQMQRAMREYWDDLLKKTVQAWSNV